MQAHTIYQRSSGDREIDTACELYLRIGKATSKEKYCIKRPDCDKATHHLLGGSYEVTEDMAMVLD